MHDSNSTLYSNKAAHNYTYLVYLKSTLDDERRQIIQLVNYVILSGIISLFGTVSNVINLIIFYRQGLHTTINISFFALAVSDLCSLLLQQCFNVFVNPLFENSDVPVMPSGIQYIVAGVPRECFARITFLITVYITAERCFCISFPLHVKQMITPRRTVFIMSAIYCLTIVSIFPFYFSTYVTWIFYPKRNRTVIGLAFTDYRDVIDGVTLIVHAFVGMISFAAVVTFTSILIKNLSQKNSWRKTVTIDNGKTTSVTNRDRKTINMVVLIASILIVCYLPSILFFIVTFTEPEFNMGGKYSIEYINGWSIALLFEAVNSSVNIFLYFKMSSKYRKQFHLLFNLCCHVNERGYE